MSYKSEKNVERKMLAILKVLSNLQKPAGSVVIGRLVREHGVELSERAIRYHLKITDERGLTRLVNDRNGRVITSKGQREIESALVNDKVGYAISRIEELAFRTSFNYESLSGMVPMNISFFPENQFKQACKIMTPVFEKGYCASNLIAVASSGEYLGNIAVPPGKIGLATVCSIVINGALLKAGIPMDSRFGGILQLRDFLPSRFTEIIHYSGSSLDPSEIFIKARMTAVREAVINGNGKILANFREIPGICESTANKVIRGLVQTGFNGVLIVGRISEPVCEIQLDLNKMGVVLMGGLNPIAAVAEAGIETENHSMSVVIPYEKLVVYHKILK